MGFWHGDGGLRLPEIAKPSQDDLDACPESVRAYVRSLETRRSDLSGIVRLLREMDVFPDMLNRMDRLVHRRIEEARAEAARKACEVEARPSAGSPSRTDYSAPGW